MKFVYVLEDDERIKEELFEIFKNIDPTLIVRFFSDLESFHEFLIAAMKEGPRTLATSGQILEADKAESVSPADNHELKLIVANNDFFTTQNLSLLRKSRDFFVRKRICSQEQPTSIVLSAFDSPHFDLRPSQQFGINNIIFKPFDRLIVRQHLEFALKGHQANKPDTLAAIQVKASVEMLKSIDVFSLSEVGFVTHNNHTIKVGAIRKYYGDIFRTKTKNSGFAYCNSSTEVGPDEFVCEFSFMGLDSQQISQIRKTILQKKNRELPEHRNTQGRKSFILIVEDDEKTVKDLESLFSEKMSDVEIYKYSMLPQLRIDLTRGKKKADDPQPTESGSENPEVQTASAEDPAAEAQTQNADPDIENRQALASDQEESQENETSETNQELTPEVQGLYENLPAEFDMIFINYSFFAGDKKESWDSIYADLCTHAANFGISQAQKPDLYFLSKQTLSMEELTPLSEWTKDVFFTPIDKSYFLKKLVSTQKILNTKEPTTIAEVKENIPLKVANPVDVTEISEGGLVMKYNRPMSLGSFREFYMLRPSAIEVPEILGIVNFTEKDGADPTITYNHFIFYGMKDIFLKHIRLWLRETYIKGKATEE